MRRLEARRLHLPPDVSLGEATAAVRSLAGLAGLTPPRTGFHPSVSFELHLSSGEARYLLIAEPALLAQVERLVVATIPSLILEAASPPEPTLGAAVELRVTRSDRPLRTDDPAGLLSQLLARIAEPGDVALQLVLAPLVHRDRGREVGLTTPDPDQLLLDPVLTTHLRDLSRKTAEPPFAASLRLAVPGTSRRD